MQAIIDTMQTIHADNNNTQHDKYYNKRGELTRYALSCGYTQRYVYQGLRYVHEVKLHMRDGVLFVTTERGEQLYAGNNLQDARNTYNAERNAIRHTFRK